MADNPYYDESMHKDCADALRLFLKLYFEFAARCPTSLPASSVYVASEIMNSIENNEFDLKQMAELYYHITKELAEEDNLMKFVRLPLLFISQEMTETEDGD